MRSPRSYGDVTVIPLSRGKCTVVDTIDAEVADRRSWYAVSANRRTFYACGKYKRVARFLHRIISERMGLPLDREIDHVDGDGLNNRRCNLRPATRAQNCRNVGVRSDNKSGYKGISRASRGLGWKAQIKCNGRSFSLGTFADIDSAVAAYKTAAFRLFGEFARTQ